MSELSDAYTELAEAKAEACGKPDVVILDGRQVENAIAEEMTFDEVIGSGGNPEAGGFRVHIPCSEVMEPPRKGSDIEVNGFALEVLGGVVKRNETTYEVPAGDPVAED